MAQLFTAKDAFTIGNKDYKLVGYASDNIYNTIKTQDVSTEKFHKKGDTPLKASDVIEWVNGYMGDTAWNQQTIFTTTNFNMFKEIFPNHFELDHAGLAINKKVYSDVSKGGKISTTMKAGRIRYRRNIDDPPQLTAALGLEGYIDSPTTTTNYMGPFTSQSWFASFQEGDSTQSTDYSQCQIRWHCMPETIIQNGLFDYSVLRPKLPNQASRLPVITLTVYYWHKVPFDPTSGIQEEYSWSINLEFSYTDIYDFNIISGQDIIDGTPGEIKKETPVKPGNPDDSGENSSPSGGGGDYDGTSTPVDFPGKPVLDVLDTGLVTLWSLQTQEEIFSFYRVLWTNLEDLLVNILKLFNNPVDAIISFGIIPFVPPFSEPMQVYFGNQIMPGIQWPMVTEQYVLVDMGSIKLHPYYGSFLDYSPYTKVKLYLPYIGWVELDADEVMGIEMFLEYHVDVLTGDCIAFIKCDDSVKYTFNGNCLTKIPITASNAQDMFLAATEVIGKGIMMSTSVAGAAMVATPAQKKFSDVNSQLDNTFQQSAPDTIDTTSIPQLSSIASACGNVMSGKGGISHGSLMSSGIGYMGRQRPYVIVEYPDMSRPDNFARFCGNRSNIRITIGECSGFVQMQSVWLSGIPATAIELEEIEGFLKGGVIV